MCKHIIDENDYERGARKERERIAKWLEYQGFNYPDSPIPQLLRLLAEKIRLL